MLTIQQMIDAIEILSQKINELKTEVQHLKDTSTLIEDNSELLNAVREIKEQKALLKFLLILSLSKKNLSQTTEELNFSLLQPKPA